MIARLTRILLVVQLLVAVIIAAVLVKFFHLEHPFLALIAGIAVVVLLRMQITANNFFLSSRYRSTVPAGRRLTWWQACALFLDEFRSTMTASSYTMPFHAFTRRVADKPKALPVLLIHGYGCNSGYWHFMSKALMRAQITHYAVSLEPVIGGIDDYVDAVHNAIETIRAETGSEKVIIVAHSMGGLVARAYLRDHGIAHIARVITLGTPHHGTGVARYGVGQNCREMHWTPDADGGVSSEWLRRLAESEDKDVSRMLVSIYSHHDNIISPQTSSHLPGATNIEFFGIGHVALAFNPSVQARVIAEIREASRQQVTVPSAKAAEARASRLS